MLAIPVFMIAILPLSPYFLHNKASLSCDNGCAPGYDICPPLGVIIVASLLYSGIEWLVFVLFLLGGGGYPYRVFLFA
tara:strand:- start:1601 stop:1834 length:234 start_codon:yes stop_codon:yes gene_type:complete